ncbi:hypothetical protein KCU92_g54, partial [Aureobasidium melanogenum]
MLAKSRLRIVVYSSCGGGGGGGGCTGGGAAAEFAGPRAGSCDRRDDLRHILSYVRRSKRYLVAHVRRVAINGVCVIWRWGCMAMWWILRRCSIGDVRRRRRRKVLWWWRLVVLEVVTVLGMHWRCGRDRCRGMRRRLMLAQHEIRVVVSHGSSIPRSYLRYASNRLSRAESIQQSINKTHVARLTLETAASVGGGSDDGQKNGSKRASLPEGLCFSLSIVRVHALFRGLDTKSVLNSWQACTRRYCSHKAVDNML